MSPQKQPHEQTYRELLGDASFSVAARVALQLGRESISSSVVAISELVKNAYDADAEVVKIRFAGLDTDTPFLVIEDDGDGMTEQQLREHWMVIGTSNKLISGRSERKRRVLTGEKGLGRLGLDRLCERTVVQSFPEEESRGVELEIDWHKYENTNERLEDITHLLYNIPKLVEDPITGISTDIMKGTWLILYGLKDAWTKEFLLDLKQELALLVSPFAGINDFAIELDSGMGWAEVDGPVSSPEMLKVSEWELVANIDDNGNVSYVMSSSYYDGEYRLGPTPWKEAILGRGELPRCGPLRFEMHFFPRRKVTLGDLSFSKAQIDGFLDFNQGIRIYRDDFRVRPYGQPNGEGDWLSLAYRREQSPSGVTQGKKPGAWRVGYNQVVGAVFIGRDQNSSLIDQTNRERIVEGPAFYDLKAFASAAIRFFELSREEFERARKKPTEYEKVREEAEEASRASQEAVENLRATASKVKEMLQDAQESGVVPDLEEMGGLLDNAIEEVGDTVTSGQKAQSRLAAVSEEQQEEFQRQKDTLANLASLGILTNCFAHETLAASNVVVTNARQLKRNMDRGLFMVTPDVRETVESNIEFIVSRAVRIETFAGFTLKNISRDKRKRKAIDLSRVVKQVFSSFEKSLDERNITARLILPERVSPILAFEIDWESIFVNLITNAVWALRDTEAGKRTIRVSMQEIENHLEIAFADSGCGLEAGTEDKIFLPTFSTKRNAKGEVVGTGMGLTIVKSFVEDYEGGLIRVESPCDLGGAQFHTRVQIPNLAGRGKKGAG